MKTIDVEGVKLGDVVIITGKNDSYFRYVGVLAGYEGGTGYKYAIRLQCGKITWATGIKKRTTEKCDMATNGKLLDSEVI